MTNPDIAEPREEARGGGGGGGGFFWRVGEGEVKMKTI